VAPTTDPSRVRAGIGAYGTARDAAIAPAADVDDLLRKVQVLSFNEMLRGADELCRRERYTEARTLFARALTVESKTQSLSRAATGIVQTFQDATGVNVAACRTWTQANVTNSDDRLRIELAMGEIFYRNQDFDRALAQIEPVAREKGRIGESAAMVAALCLLGKGERVAAVMRLNQVATETPSDEIASKALFLIGWAYLQSQQYGSAKAAFDRLRRKYPQSPFAKKASELNERLKAYDRK
jgi:tetratricopeptide (TPR) repeat protein